MRNFGWSRFERLEASVSSNLTRLSTGKLRFRREAFFISIVLISFGVRRLTGILKQRVDLPKEDRVLERWEVNYRRMFGEN